MIPAKTWAALAMLAAACDATVGPGRLDDAGDDAQDGEPCVGEDCADAGPVEEGPARYGLDETLSPITPFVAERLRAARGGGLAEDVFAKVGDSLTVDASFLHCFAGASVDLGGRDELSATLEHFLGGRVDGVTPFERESLAASVGWTATAPLAGAPSPLARELDALEPTFALVLFGTNDVGAGDPVAYGEDMWALVDTLLGRGVIPLLSSIPPRDDDPEIDARVPVFNAVVRGLAQGRQVPFMDLERRLRALDGLGLGEDGVHPDAYVDGGPRACVLSAEGLQHGFNERNLLSLETLHRVRQVVLEGAVAPDAPQVRRGGGGTAAAPFAIDATTWSDLATTAGAPSDALDRYSGCAATQDESGPEIVYELVLDAPATVEALVIDGADADVDLHLLGGDVREDACLRRHDRQFLATLDAGLYYLVLDSYVPADGRPRAGEFLLVVRTTPP